MQKNSAMIWRMALAAGFALTVGSQSVAQDEGSSGDVTAEAEAPVVEAEAPAVEVKPRPAEMMPLTAKSMLLDVVRANGGLVAVGDRGAVVLSTDGKRWTQVASPVRSALTAVYFADENHGWAVGHDSTIIATADAGKTWTLQMFKPSFEKPFLDVLFLDAQRGFAVGAYGLFYVTTDGGATWVQADAPAIMGEELHFNAITRLGNGDILIAGESGMMGVSGDAGATWSRLKSPYDSSLFGVLPMGDTGALAFGLRGNAFSTSDVRGGKWAKVETGSVASMFGGAVLPSGEMAMVGLNGVILVTDAGGTVRTLSTPAGTPLSGAMAYDGGLLLVGESGVQSLALK